MRQRRKDAARHGSGQGHADGSTGRAEPSKADGAAGAPARARDPAATSPQLKETLGAAVLTSIVLSVYTRTLYPSIAGGDSGELVAEACHLGVAHPPGYPLYTMLVHTFTRFLPLGGSVAWRANLFSAVCDTIAVVLLYHSILLYTASRRDQAGRHTCAFTAAALFAFSPLIWTYAVGAEVFALNNLFAALLLYSLLRYAKDQKLQTALYGAFTCGLAMCNQHTIVLLEIPIILWVLWTRRRTILGKELALVSTAFLLGLLPYLYLPIAGAWNPQPGSWGNVTTFMGFFHHLRRADYGTFQLFSGTTRATEGLWERLRAYSIDLTTREIPFHLAMPIAGLGMYKMMASDSVRANVGRLVVVSYGFYMVVFHTLANLPLSEGLTYGVHMRFWQQPNVIVFLWFGIGLHSAMNVITSQVSVPSVSAGIAWIWRGGCLALVAFQLATWFQLCDQSQAWYISNYAAALLDPLPRNAVLFANFDLQWTALRYLQRCENRRSDVTVMNLSLMTYRWFEHHHDRYPSLAFPGTRLVPFGGKSDGFSFARFLDENYDYVPPRTVGLGQRRRIFLGGKQIYMDQDFQAKYSYIPYGLLDEIHRQSDESPQLPDWYKLQKKVKRIVRDRLPKLPPADIYNDETWEWTIARDHGMKALSWSTYLLEKTIAEDPHNLKLLAESTHAMEASYQFEPVQFWNAAANLKNLGLAYAQIVKSNQEFTAADPFFNDAVGPNVEDKSRYKDRASARMLQVWNAWLQVPEAPHDPGFSAIEGVVRKFLTESQDTQRKHRIHSDLETASAAAKPKKKKKKAKQKKQEPATVQQPPKRQITRMSQRKVTVF